jgi:hypothetical protein
MRCWAEISRSADEHIIGSDDGCGRAEVSRVPAAAVVGRPRWEAGWLASLEEPHSSFHHGFVALAQLCTFLLEQADGGPNSDDTPSDNQS